MWCQITLLCLVGVAMTHADAVSEVTRHDEHGHGWKNVVVHKHHRHHDDHGHHVRVHHDSHDRHDHHDDHHPKHKPSYKFSYSVSDKHTGDQKQQEEINDGGHVRGSYSLVQPDGHKRIVHYTADGHKGFRADVDYKTVHDHHHHH